MGLFVECCIIVALACWFYYTTGLEYIMLESPAYDDMSK